MPFSPDSENSPPPLNFRPGPGQTGAGAAMKAIGHGRKGSGRQPSRRSSPDTRQPGLGLPAPSEGPAAPEPDYRGLLAMAQHKNMTSLGRDVPFGIWAVNSGLWRKILPPGQVPYDVLEHAFDGG